MANHGKLHKEEQQNVDFFKIIDLALQLHLYFKSRFYFCFYPSTVDLDPQAIVHIK